MSLKAAAIGNSVRFELSTENCSAMVRFGLWMCLMMIIMVVFVRLKVIGFGELKMLCFILLVIGLREFFR